MPKSLAQIQKRIDALQRKAEEFKRKEAVSVIARIKEAIRHYGLTAHDLGLTRALPSGKTSHRRKVLKGAAKYRSETGQTWTGHGRRPQWFIDALAAGRKAEDLKA